MQYRYRNTAKNNNYIAPYLFLILGAPILFSLIIQTMMNCNFPLLFPQRPYDDLYIAEETTPPGPGEYNII